jgi:hypothetical protein
MSRWTLDDIPWDRFDPSCVEPNLLAIVKTAALVERNAGEYVRYLCSVFAADAEFRLEAVRWGSEEVQHGMALGRWATMADPHFDFERRFQAFVEGYQLPLDATASVRGSHVGELIARCVVESGTSCYYSTLRDATEEPVLKAICHRIAGDEFRHYKLFYDAMQRFTAAEPLSLWQRCRVAFNRFIEIEDDELAFAYYCANNTGEPYDRKAAGEAYLRRSARYYREEHVRRAATMMAKAAGLNGQGMLTTFAAWAAWSYTRWKARLPLAA